MKVRKGPDWLPSAPNHSIASSKEEEEEEEENRKRRRRENHRQKEGEVMKIEENRVKVKWTFFGKSWYSYDTDCLEIVSIEFWEEAIRFARDQETEEQWEQAVEDARNEEAK